MHTMVALTWEFWVQRYPIIINYSMATVFLKMYGVVSVISGMAAIWSLTCITMERAWVISNISKQAYPWVSMSKMKFYILIIWSAAIAASIVPLMGWNKYIYEVGSWYSLYSRPYFPACQGYLFSSTVDYLSKDRSSQQFIWLLLAVGWVGPSCATIYSHGSIVYINRSICKVVHCKACFRTSHALF